MYRVEHPATARLVVEISDSTLAYDRADKLRLYAAAAIPAYWVLDLSGRLLHAYARPIGSGYADHELIPEDGAVRLPWSDERIAVADLLP
jgi:Uma2 family endonuclease